MLSEFISLLAFAFGVTAPIFVLVFLGVFLKRIQFIDDAFMNSATKLVFNISLPCLLFVSMVKTDIQSVINGPYLLIALLGTFAAFIALSLIAPFIVKNKKDRGVFVQGGFRSNLAIIGLAFVLNAYGEQGLAKASILISAVTVLYNILSIYTLQTNLSETRIKVQELILSIVKNPLIIAILSGIAVNLIGLPIPEFAITSGEYLSYMTLPLALICIGGTISLAEFKKSSAVSLTAVFFKLVIAPFLIVYPAYLWGFSKTDIGILFLMVACPTAAASYVMVKGVGGNAKLAANIIVISTLLSLFSVSFGLAFLKYYGVV